MNNIVLPPQTEANRKSRGLISSSRKQCTCPVILAAFGGWPWCCDEHGSLTSNRSHQDGSGQSKLVDIL